MRWPVAPVSPALQWADPLAARLLLYHVYSAGAGPNAVDLVDGGRATFTGGAASPPGPSWTRGHAGPELSYNGEVRYLSCPVRGLPTGNVDRTVAVAYRSTAGGNNLYFFHYGSTAGSNDMFAVGLDNAGQLRLTTWAAGDNVAGVNAADGLPHVAAWVYRAALNQWTVWFDGRLAGLFARNVTIAANPVLNIGSLVGAANLPYIGQLAAVAFWDRALTAESIARFTADPFGLARRPSYLDLWASLPFVVPAPGGEYYPARYFAARYFARPYFGSGEAVVGVSGPTYLMSIARTVPGEATGSFARALPTAPTVGSIPRTLADEPTSAGITSFD